MKMTGDQQIAAPRQKVWEALNDPDVLKQCIPGCQSLERESETRMKATLAIKIGPISARFAGAVTLTDLDPPNSYTISGEGQGGAAGSAKGGAKIRLADDSGATQLSYEVDVQVGGRLAQLGGPIIDATAKQLAGVFFKRFGELVASGPEAAPAQPAESAPETDQRATAPSAARSAPTRHAAPLTSATAAAGQPTGLPMAWILAVVVAALVGFLVGKAHGGDMSDWAGLSIGLLVIVVAAAGFEFGRRAAAPVVTLDAASLDRLLGGDKP